jgi:DNA-binding HxlR family transcriptional regulator
MKNNLKNTDFALDEGGRLILTSYQSQVLLYLFEHGPDYVYSLKTKTGISQQTLDALTKRLDAGGLIYKKEVINVVKKGLPRKVYSLTAGGWCGTAMLLLTSKDSSLAHEDITRVLDCGLRHADVAKKSLFLKHWRSIIRAADDHPGSLDFHSCTNWDLNASYYKKVPELFVSKNNPRWVWYASLYYACWCYLGDWLGACSSNGSESLQTLNKYQSEFIDVMFANYIMTGSHLPWNPPLWVTYCCEILRVNDELSKFMTEMFRSQIKSNEEGIQRYLAALTVLEGKSPGVRASAEERGSSQVVVDTPDVEAIERLFGDKIRRVTNG